VLWRCPPEMKTLERVWGTAPPDLAMMRAIKQQFDPDLVFNPGRFVGGI
jgi:glycolate oxidase FAD binding subunit